MNQITQGTLIRGVRFAKYPDISCSGVVITARCDLANTKTEKIFYICAVPLSEWIFSHEGIRIVFSSKINDISNKLNSVCSKYGLDYEALLSFSKDEREVVIQDKDLNIIESDRNTISDLIGQLQVFIADSVDRIELNSVIEKTKKSVIKALVDISNGKVSHFCFLPEKALFNTKCINNGFIIDLQEIDYLTREEAEILCECIMDSQSLSPNRIKKYKDKFTLNDGLGYSIIDCTIQSPWIEYIMQRFSNSFTRIGVDNMQKEEATQAVELICRNELKEV